MASMRSISAPAATGFGELREQEAKPAQVQEPPAEPIPLPQERIARPRLTILETDPTRIPPIRVEQELPPTEKEPRPVNLNEMLKERVQEFPQEWRKGLVNAYSEMMVTPEKAKDLIRKGEWRQVTDLAEGGMFPTAEEIGMDFYLEAKRRFEKEGGTRGKSKLRLLDNAMMNPNAWRQRQAVFEGQLPDFQLVSMDWAIRHPKAAVIPLMLGGTIQEIAKLPSHPEKWPEWAVWIAADRLLIAPATRAFIDAAKSSGSIMGRPLSEVFAKRMPITVETIQNMQGVNPTVAKELIDAWKKMPGKEKAFVSRMAKRGARINYMRPRFVKGAEGTISIAESTPFAEMPSVPPTVPSEVPTVTGEPGLLPVPVAEQAVTVPPAGVPVSEAAKVVGTDLLSRLQIDIGALPTNPTMEQMGKVAKKYNLEVLAAPEGLAGIYTTDDVYAETGIPGELGTVLIDPNMIPEVGTVRDVFAHEIGHQLYESLSDAEKLEWERSRRNCRRIPTRT
jgi:hypothetical protein